jgi:hypothetical protein
MGFFETVLNIHFRVSLGEKYTQQVLKINLSKNNSVLQQIIREHFKQFTCA